MQKFHLIVKLLESKCTPKVMHLHLKTHCKNVSQLTFGFQKLFSQHLKYVLDYLLHYGLLGHSGGHQMKPTVENFIAQNLTSFTALTHSYKKNGHYNSHMGIKNWTLRCYWKFKSDRDSLQKRTGEWGVHRCWLTIWLVVWTLDLRNECLLEEMNTNMMLCKC